MDASHSPSPHHSLQGSEAENPVHHTVQDLHPVPQQQQHRELGGQAPELQTHHHQTQRPLQIPPQPARLTPQQPQLQNCRNKDNMFQCPYPQCARAFARRYNLATHYATHFGVREFECKECPRKLLSQWVPRSRFPQRAPEFEKSIAKRIVCTNFTRKYDLNRHQGIKHGPFIDAALPAQESTNSAQQAQHPQRQLQQAQPTQQQAQQPKKRKAPASTLATPAAASTNGPVRRSARNRRVSDEQTGDASQPGAGEQPSPPQQQQQPGPKKVKRSLSMDDNSAVPPSPLAHYGTRTSTGDMEGKSVASSHQQQHQQQQLVGSIASQSAMDAAAVGLLEGISSNQHKSSTHGVPDDLRATSMHSSAAVSDGNDTALAAQAAAQAAAYATYLANTSLLGRPTPLMAAAAAAAGVGAVEIGGGLETQQQHPQNYAITAAALRSGKLSMQVDGDRVSIVRHDGVLPSVSRHSLNHPAYLPPPQPAIPDCSALERELLARFQAQEQPPKSEETAGTFLAAAPVPTATSAAVTALTAAAQEVTPPPSAHSSSRTSSLSSVHLPEGPGSSNLALPALVPSTAQTESATVSSPTPQINSEEPLAAGNNETSVTADGLAESLANSLSPDDLAIVPADASATSPLPTTTGSGLNAGAIRPLETEEERRAIAVAMLLEIPGTMAQRSSST
ncbi:hypothetical protein HDU86_005677 [Geranomyces michiganensis]|nr:hypothetical protein HDU86_005677 [Geranomyces michiganensis]